MNATAFVGFVVQPAGLVRLVQMAKKLFTRLLRFRVMIF
jgi:hypothetical protein